MKLPLWTKPKGITARRQGSPKRTPNSVPGSTRPNSSPDTIRGGNVDDPVLPGPQGNRVFSLIGAEDVCRVIIEAMNEGALTMDLGGYILFCNRRFCEMVEKPMEAIVGKRLASFAAPPQRHAIRTLVADAQTGPVRRRLILQSGDETPVSVQLSANLLVAAQPPCICMVVSDLTEWEASANSIKVLREQQEALAAAKDRLAADLARMSRLQEISTRLVGQGDLTSLLEEIVQAAMDITGADMGNIQLRDEAGAMQIAAHSGFGQPFLDFLNRLHRERTESACSQAMAGCKRVIIEDVTRSPVFAGSPALPVLLEAGVRAVQSTPLVSRSGEIVGMFSTLYRTPRNPGEVDLQLLDLLARQAADLIERMQVIEALNRRSAQLEAANEELESFSYSVSHDLRAPLRAIDGYSRMILRNHADRFDEDARGKFNVIRDNTRMMGQLIEDLLAFSRLGKPISPLARLDIGGLIGEIWEELKAASPDRRLTLKTAKIPPCMGDQGLIKQVFVNILANAVKFTKTREEALIEVGENAEGDGLPITSGTTASDSTCNTMTRCSAFSSASTATTNSREPAWASPSSSGSSTGTAAASGRKARRVRGQPFTWPSPRKKPGRKAHPPPLPGSRAVRIAAGPAHGSAAPVFDHPPALDARAPRMHRGLHLAPQPFAAIGEDRLGHRVDAGEDAVLPETRREMAGDAEELLDDLATPFPRVTEIERRTLFSPSILI